MKKDIDKVAVVIGARLHSERVPMKLWVAFDDAKGLLEICMQKVVNLPLPSTKKFLAAGDLPLIKLALQYKQYKDINIIKRSKESRETDTDLDLMYEWRKPLMEKGFEYAVLINPCLPFIKEETIMDFINKYCEHYHRGQFGVIETQDYYWDEGGGLIRGHRPEKNSMMNTKKAQKTYRAAHALYAGRLHDIDNGTWMGNFVPNDPVLYTINEAECMDVDYMWQMEAYSALYSSGWRP